jgi:pyruvate/2-oxoglutarate dehydrogenase complex dihydrolipoamide dehydrogenase (E3) component
MGQGITAENESSPLQEGVLVSPMDAHNRKLVSHVHPPDWVNPEPADRYNLVVLGAGTAGLVTAAGAAGLGARVALVEKHLLGGDCLNAGCVPSKCVIRSSRAVAHARDAGRFGVRVSGAVEPDFAAVMERMRRLRAGISEHDSASRFQGLGVDVFLGEARFSGPDRVEVAGKTLRFRNAVIATGARAVAPPIEGLPETGYLTNETVFDLTERPTRLACIGGGPIGSELAQAFRRLGSEVTLFEAGPHILGREDADAAEIVQQAFLREGIRLILGCTVQRVEEKDGEKVVHFRSDGEDASAAVDEILVGAGRAPNVEGLNLDAVGVRFDTKQGIEVNDRLQTTNPQVYAAGDVCMQWKFTHAADAAARIVIQNSLFLGRKKLSALTMPWCTYTDPEIAHVGLYEEVAQEKGIALDTFVRHLRDVDRAVVDGEVEGFVKVHVRKGTDSILGATIVAPHAGEMIGELTLAIAQKIGLKRIAGVIHPYPTQAEAIKQIADLYNRTRLTPAAKKWFGRWMAWRR